ncbi:hypothetical protein V5O48_014631, partial [Marasmius crinis-equi]
MEKSQGCPLYIWIDTAEPSTDADNDVWEILAEHFCQCAELVLDMFDLQAFLETVTTSEVSFASLTVLNAASTECPFDTEFWFWEAMALAAKLTTVRIPYMLPTLALPYPQLTQLKLGFLTNLYYDRFLDVLHLSAVGANRSIDWEPVEADDTFLGCLLASLEMPSLHTFQLAFTDTLGESDSEALWSSALLAFLSRSSASLQRLTLRIQYFRALLQPLSVLLQNTPRLTRFELHIEHSEPSESNFHSMDDYVASFLLALEVQFTLLPNLSSLMLQFEESMHVAHSKVIERMLKLAMARGTDSPSTAAGVRPLTSLRLQRLHGSSLCTFVPSQAVTQVITSLREVGVAVDIEDVQGSFLELTADEGSPEYESASSS